MEEESKPLVEESSVIKDSEQPDQEQSDLREDELGSSELGSGGGGHDDDLSDISDTGWDTDLEIEDEKEEYDPTGTADYIKACYALGVVPTNHFIRSLQSQDTTIELSNHYVGPVGAKAIAMTLKSNTTATHLYLENNGLGTDGGVAIMDMLKENCYITHINLSGNTLGTPGAYGIQEMLQNNSTVTHCYLSGVAFDDKAAEPISETMKSSLKITYLDLSHNQFSEAGSIMLGAAIGESEVLQTLNLSWNHIRRKGAVAIAQGLKVNQMLKVLNLSYNGLASEGAVALADALKVNTTLVELDITDNRILTDGIKAFAKVLPATESLKTLKVGKNPIQMVGVLSLLDALKTGSSSIKELSLEGITVTINTSTIISDMMKELTGLVITHGGTGGYKVPKPILSPLEKLFKYAAENDVRLRDLFMIFDKERLGYLNEEEFRAALKHISAPLMSYEVVKLLKEYGITEKTEEGEPEPKILIDYNAFVEITIPPTGSIN